MKLLAGSPNPRVEPLLPISRGPFDVLSYIFEICGGKDYRTALKIAVVSRHWREVVLATPRAWAFVDIENCRHDDLVKLYLERSSPRPLHISVPFQRNFGLFSNVTDRIRCLSICGTHEEDFGRAVFPNVTRLTITGLNTHIEGSIVSLKQFPALRHLVSEPSWSYAAAHGDLPPLQSLSLVMGQSLHWVFTLVDCKDTLTSLRLTLRARHTSVARPRIVLPRLRCLEIQYWHAQEDMWPLKLDTPILKTYIEAEDRPHSGIHLHLDLETVQYMRTDRVPPLRVLLKLRELQLDGRPTVGEAVLDMLLEDFALCPELTLINQVVGKVGKMKQKLAEINKTRSIPIRLRSVIRTEDLPGIIPSSVRKLRC